jgi:glyoxylase-like metal-dependent hydrolase (beta-lactamase superfamily II)
MNRNRFLRLFLLVFAVSLPWSGHAQAQSAIPKIEITKTDIAPGIYQFTSSDDGYVEQLNSLIIINAEDVLVFDTMTRPSSARTVLAEIRKLTPKPVRYVVNSHWHPDHWSGNEVYADAFPGLDIIATKECEQYMRHAAPPWTGSFKRTVVRLQTAYDEAVKTGKNPDGSAFTAEDRRQAEHDLVLFRDFEKENETVRRTYPTLTYHDHLTLQHGGREFQFLSVAGDAKGTTVMYMPKERVLATGDTIVFPIPYSTPPPSERIKSLKELAQLDFAILIPGHGPAFRDREYFNLQIDLLEAAVKQVKQALQGGASTQDEVYAKMDMSAIREKFAHGDKKLAERFDTHVRRNLMPQAIREAREQEFRQ